MTALLQMIFSTDWIMMLIGGVFALVMTLLTAFGIFK